jgi:hypothetical protein
MTMSNIRLDQPCQIPWETMQGDDRVRFCTQCNLHVHNLSVMTEAEATDLLTSRPGRTCVAFLPQPNGSPTFQAEPASTSSGGRSLPVLQYRTPPKAGRRWVVPAAIAGTVAAAGATAALKPRVTPPKAVAPGTLMRGGVVAMSAVPFDPDKPSCEKTKNEVQATSERDPVARSIKTYLPEPLELVDLRYNVYPKNAKSTYGKAYVIRGGDAEKRLTLWLLPLGTKNENHATGPAPSGNGRSARIVHRRRRRKQRGTDRRVGTRRRGRRTSYTLNRKCVTSPSFIT